MNNLTYTKYNFPPSSAVSPIAVPPYKGTHGARIAGDNTQHSHRKVPFTHYATTLCAPATQQHGAVARTFRQARRSMRSPPCGSNSVFEVAHSVNKNTPNKFSFRAQPKNFVIASMQSGATCSQGLRSACIHVATPLKKAKP